MVKGVGEPRRGAATGRVAASYRAVAGIGAVALVGALLTGAPAAAAAPVGTLNPATSTASAGESSDSEAAAKRLADRIRATLGSRAGQVSVVVHDRKSGTTVTHNGSLRVETASIVKVMILVAVIDHRRANGSGLTSSDRALARKMIRVSDNAAASTLLGRAGGKPALDRLAKRLGMKHTATSWSWGLTRTSAADQVRLVDAILDGKALPRDSDRDYVLGLMGDVVEEQAWGVGSVPASASAQVKNGWLPRGSTGWRINSIGHVSGSGRDYTMAMLSTRGRSMGSGVATLDRVSEVVFAGVTALGSEQGGTATNASAPMHATALADGEQPSAIPAGAPAWFDRPGTAFRPYPTR